MHWANQYIRTPYRRNPGPGEYNCASLFLDVQNTHYGRAVTLFGPDPDHAQIRALLSQFDEVVKPTDGDAVTAWYGGQLHVGTWLDVDGGKVLHTSAGAGGSCLSLRELEAAGWGTFRFYTWRCIDA